MMLRVRVQLIMLLQQKMMGQITTAQMMKTLRKKPLLVLQILRAMNGLVLITKTLVLPSGNSNRLKKVA